MHRVLQVHQAVPKQCTHMQTNTQHPWNTNRGGGGNREVETTAGYTGLVVHCTLHAHQSTLHKAQWAEGEYYQRTTLKTARLHLLTTQLHPGLTILQGERETDFFFSFFTPHVSQGSVSIQLNVDVWEALKTQQSTRHWSLTSCNYTVLRLHCSDWMTLFPVKING